MHMIIKNSLMLVLCLWKDAFRVFDSLSMKSSFFRSSVLVRLYNLLNSFRCHWVRVAFRLLENHTPV